MPVVAATARKCACCLRVTIGAGSMTRRGPGLARAQRSLARVVKYPADRPVKPFWNTGGDASSGGGGGGGGSGGSSNGGSGSSKRAVCKGGNSGPPVFPTHTLALV